MSTIINTVGPGGDFCSLAAWEASMTNANAHYVANVHPDYTTQNFRVTKPFAKGSATINFLRPGEWRA